MPAVLDEALLERGEKGSFFRGSRRVVVAAAVVGLVLTATIAGYSVAKLSGHSRVDRGLIQTQLASWTEDYQSSGQLPGVAFSESCYGFAGAECVQGACDARSKATCEGASSSIFGSSAGLCVCPGGCVGADGTCYSQSYTKVASKIVLSSKKWPSHWLYMQRTSITAHLAVSRSPSWTFLGAQYFDVYALPGKFNGKRKFIIASNKWPKWLATMQFPTLVGHGLFGLPLPPWPDSETWMFAAPQFISVEICLHGATGEVMIGNVPDDDVGTKSEWAYVHGYSWTVYGSEDPGEGGHWTIADENSHAVDIAGLEHC